MKNVVLVAPHFVPSFLPSVHRARLWSYHLPEFGWRPIILTTDPAFYECAVSADLEHLLPPDLLIRRTRALPTRPVRLIGDIAARSLPWYWAALKDLRREPGIDFVHFTVPAFNAALLGPSVDSRLKVPYGIDYIDPLIHETSLGERFLSKAWLAQKLGHVIEPFAVRRARAITGINPAYFQSVLRRNPHLVRQAATAGMPYGGSERDFEALDRAPRPTSLFTPGDGLVHVMYAGALLPKAFAVADRLMEALAILRERRRDQAERLRLHFVGTGTKEQDANSGHTVRPFIEKHGVGALASEMPARIGYLDVLNHLRAATFNLVIGSTEPHYSPSKIYQSVMAGKPVLALLHRESTAVPTLQASQAGQVITFAEHHLPEPAALAHALSEFIDALPARVHQVDWAAFESVTARASARVLAETLDRGLKLANDGRN